MPPANWSSLDIDDGSEVRTFGRVAEENGRAVVAKAIAGHKAAGNAVYYASNGQIVKEMADGRRFEVFVDRDGSERIGEELPPR